MGCAYFTSFGSFCSKVYMMLDFYTTCTCHTIKVRQKENFESRSRGNVASWVLRFNKLVLFVPTSSAAKHSYFEFSSRLEFFCCCHSLWVQQQQKLQTGRRKKNPSYKNLSFPILQKAVSSHKYLSHIFDSDV